MRGLFLAALLLGLNSCQQVFAGEIVPPAFASLHSGLPRGGAGAEIVADAARAEGVPVAFALAIARVESRADCFIGRSISGAVGIMQVLPRTAAAMGVSRAELATCAGSARAGMRYLKAALTRAGGDRALAATLYNRGLGAPLRVTPYGRSVLAKK